METSWGLWSFPGREARGSGSALTSPPQLGPLHSDPGAVCISTASCPWPSGARSVSWPHVCFSLPSGGWSPVGLSSSAQDRDHDCDPSNSWAPPSESRRCTWLGGRRGLWEPLSHVFHLFLLRIQKESLIPFCIDGSPSSAEAGCATGRGQEDFAMKDGTTSFPTGLPPLPQKKGHGGLKVARSCLTTAWTLPGIKSKPDVVPSPRGPGVPS